LDPLPEERTERNNTREISIEVLQNRIRVLLAAAHPDWDTAFWARTLRDDPNVQLTAVMLDATRTWRRDNGATFEWPRGAAWGRDFGLYILGPVRGALRADAATELRTAVERGKGLLVLGGADGVLGDAAAYETLRAVLPVERGAARVPDYGESHARLAPQGRH